ncbi:MAG: response regulator transcription factor [Alistipes sp.]|nr:response regulator transcription factor [Alistipes sp.]
MGYRILLVDDENDILEFVRYNLVREGYEVFTAPNGEEGLREALAHRPHLILLDMMMPVMDGEATLRAIRSHPELSRTLVAFLTALGADEQQVAGFDLGADDYITKPIRMKILVSRVQALLKRLPAETERLRGIAIDRARHTVAVDGREIANMPRKEFALLELLVSSPGRLFTREEIYTCVWGDDVVGGDRTIDVHIRKLRRKIGDDRISTIKGVGYKYLP